MKNEIYVSVDIEADGPIPGPHSMLSFGCAAYTQEKELIATFTANLETLPGASPDPKTSKWWETQPIAWAACRQNLIEPAEAMKQYAKWVKLLPGNPVLIAYPVAFDVMFMHWYAVRFLGRDPFSFNALDIRSYATAVLKKDFNECMMRNLPKHWFDDFPHTHIALDDAIEQGALFCNMLKENRSNNSDHAIHEK